MRYWVFTIGTRDIAPPLNWLAEWRHHTQEMWFPDHKRPATVGPRDRALIYGSRGSGLLGAVEVTTGEAEPNDDRRYRWKLGYRLLISKAADGNVATPESAGIQRRRVMRGPHTEISEDQYRRGAAAVLRAAAQTVA